jgi:hypothetical protein
MARRGFSTADIADDLKRVNARKGEVAIDTARGVDRSLRN